MLKMFRVVSTVIAVSAYAGLVYFCLAFSSLVYGGQRVEPEVLNKSVCYSITLSTITATPIFQLGNDYNRMVGNLYPNNIGYDIAIGTFAAVTYSTTEGNNFIISANLPYYSFNDILYRHVQQFWAILDPAAAGDKVIKVFEGRK
jgi:hypothetical protein